MATILSNFVAQHLNDPVYVLKYVFPIQIIDNLGHPVMYRRNAPSRTER